jgi:S-formylglutathione hydrolase
MSCGKSSKLVTLFTLVMLFVVGCGNVPVPTPAAEAPAVAPTVAPPAEPPTVAPTAEAPTATPTAPPTTQPVPSPAPTVPAVQYVYDTITSQALAGNLLGDPVERTAHILLPPGYAASDKRYPVVYVTPWGEGDPSGNAAGFAIAMDSLLRNGEVNEMIVVVPDGTNKLGASQFRSSATIGDYEGYFTQEVVDYVDAHYRTLPTRESRGLAGCSTGGGASMRLGLRYPNVFSVVAATDGSYDDSLEMWPGDLDTVRGLKELPGEVSDLEKLGMTGWYIQAAAGTAPDPNKPPFYCEMPFRIVNGRGEFVPEVIAKIVENDAAHEARRYVQQPVRLRGIRFQHGLDDTDYSAQVHSFEKLLTDMGIEHEYVEEKTGHCGHGWEAATLKYMSDKLAFEED